MNQTLHGLYQRISAYSPDDAATKFTFTDRLARENAWDYGFARRVVDEYKRFMFLAVAAGHPVTPSEHVDQAWHLHLIYTRSYWDEFCGQVLGQPIHHGPTKGGSEEQDKYHDWYEQTKVSYTQLFGEAPPDDIWPDAADRFGDDLENVRVNTRRNWIIPKPRSTTRSAIAVATLAIFTITTVRILWGVLRGDEAVEDVSVFPPPMLTAMSGDGFFQAVQFRHANAQLGTGGIVVIVFAIVAAIIIALNALFGNKCAKCGQFRAMRRTGASQRGVGFFAGTKYEWKCRYCKASVWRAASSGGGSSGCGSTSGCGSGCNSGGSCGDGGCGASGCGGGGCGGGGCGGGGGD